MPTPPVIPIAHAQLCRAIADRRLISFQYQDRRRIAEPHDYGVIAGKPTLFFFQVAGESRSGKPIGWRQAHVLDVTDLRLLDRHFPGPRPAPTGRHLPWQVLHASVSREERRERP